MGIEITQKGKMGAEEGGSDPEKPSESAGSEVKVNDSGSAGDGKEVGGGSCLMTC